MFRWRERNENERSKYELREIVEIVTVQNDYLPLKDVNWMERWSTVPNEYLNAAEKILNFQVRADDVFVVTFMKSGTTWMQEAAWLLMHDLDYDRASNEDLAYRSVYLEIVGMWKEMTHNSIEVCRNQKSPRLIKSHLPANLLPIELWQKKSKIIYVARNVKDCIVSNYHFLKGLGLWSGDIESFVSYFLTHGVVYTPFWDHIVEFWKMRNEPNIFFTTYEEMKRNLSGVIKRLCTFLERPQMTENEMKIMLEHLSFKRMKDNKRTNLTFVLKDIMPSNVKSEFEFMRRGVVGSHKDELSSETIMKIDTWTKDCLAKFDLKEEDIFGIM